MCFIHAFYCVNACVSTGIVLTILELIITLQQTSDRTATYCIYHINAVVYLLDKCD